MIDRYPIIFAISLQIVCPLGLIIEPTVLSTKRTKNIRSDMPQNSAWHPGGEGALPMFEKALGRKVPK